MYGYHNFTNIPVYQAYIFNANISDHKAQILETNVFSKTKQNTHKRRILNPQNIEIFKRSLLEKDWHEVINMKNANKKFEIYIFCLQLNNCCPLRSFSQYRKFDYSRSLHHMKSTLDLIREAYLKNKDDNTLTLFKIHREQYLEAAQVERRIRNENKIAAAKNKQNVTWQVINNETGLSKKMSHEGVPSAQIFNEHFIGVGTNISKQIPDTSTSFIDFLKKFNI
ncbi:hypothetical protein WA026_012840 [Henosepilachna vigintioctopunctata]|uniref:GIY-YIG homing endonuclease n=1 Tax=Henosepilachna vigintioctopunctata TaxID=420089 RepID=A0AAW1TK06_9CUCU